MRLRRRDSLVQSFGVLLALSIVAMGLQVSCERRGLEAEYYGNTDRWQGAAMFSRVEERIPLRPQAVGAAVRSRVFSVRWTGWIWIDQAGEYTFISRTRDASYLRLDGQTLGARSGGDKARAKVRIRLDRGLYPIDIGYAHRNGQAKRFQLRWKPVDGPQSTIPSKVLFPERPSWFGLTVRRALGSTPRVQRALLGTFFLVSGLLLLWWFLKTRGHEIDKVWPRTCDWVGRRQRALYAFILATLFLITFLGSLRFAGSPYGFDDTRYMDVATFPRAEPWIVNRYVHIYLLRGFILLCGGNAFTGSELLWSFTFAVSVVAMAIAVRSFGPRLQLGTLAVALGLLFSQPMLFERIGAAYADYTAMMFVIVGVAIYLHGISRGRSPTSWHAFAIGLATVWAVKSKELGAVLLWLLPLLAFEQGRVNLRRFARRSAVWLGGVALGLVMLGALDAICLGDPLFGLRPQHFAGAQNFNFNQGPQEPRAASSWMDLVWEGHDRLNPGDASAAFLGVAVVVAVVVATWKKKRVELRLLQLMPIAYFVALMLVHTRATYIHLPRYLFPILPVACICAAALFYDSGLDDLGARRVVSPRVFVPLVVLGSLLLLVLLPLFTNRPWQAELLPMTWLQQVGWQSAGDFARNILAPVSALLVLSALAICWRQQVAGPVLLLAFAAMVFAPSFSRTIDKLATRKAVQRAETYLYPFETFEGELLSGKASKLFISPRLLRYSMCGPARTCLRIGHIYFRGHLGVGYLEGAPDPAAYAVGTMGEFTRWQRVDQALGRRTQSDPAEIIFLVSPVQ